MPRRHVCFLALLGASFCFAGKPHPLTVQDISLMLRSGYSPVAVERETAAKHFLGAIGPAEEKALNDSGAPAAFVAALKTGVYAVPAEEATALQENLAADAKRRAAQAEEARKLDALFQAKQQQAREAAAHAPSVPTQHALAASLKGDLVAAKNGNVVPADDKEIERKKFIALYFSAHWCAPCRAFTPRLVEFYNRVAPEHPDFELVFVSFDKTPSAMTSYMNQAQMPWPAVDFAKVKEKQELLRYAGSGIPCLVVIDAGGKVVSDTYVGGNYRGPEKVLAEVEQMFAVRTAAK